MSKVLCVSSKSNCLTTDKTLKSDCFKTFCTETLCLQFSVTYSTRRRRSRGCNLLLLGFGSWFSASWKWLPSSYPSGFRRHGGFWDFEFCSSCSEVLLIGKHQPETHIQTQWYLNNVSIFSGFLWLGGDVGVWPLVVSPGAGGSAGAAGASSQLVINHFPETVQCHLWHTHANMNMISFDPEILQNRKVCVLGHFLLPFKHGKN